MTEPPTSTLDAIEASERTWDAAVIGAGLAGSIAARGLARAGHRVLLVERTAFPRPKVCGCCLGPLASRTLDSIGLDGLLADCGARPLETVHLHVGRAPAHIPLRGVVGLSREALDARLAAEAVEAGAELLLETRAESAPDGTVVLRSEGRSVRVRASSVILAAGLRSHPAPGTGERKRALVGVGAVVPARAELHPDGVVGMVVDADGYVGTAPLEDGRITIASAVRAEAIRREGGAHRVVTRILRGAGLAGLVDEATRFTGVPGLHRHRVRVQDGRLLAVGDAAGFVEPITGEGMSWAIATGAAVVSEADVAIRSGPDAARWASVYRRLMRRRHLRCALVGAGIGRPRLVRTALLASSIAPTLRASALSALLGRFDPPLRKELA